MPNQPNMDRDRAVTDFTDDETHKNPIHIQLRSYDGPLNTEQLKRVVARSRDFFHTFVGTTLRRRYRRAVPIYLVDDWVVKALGVFMQRGGRRVPGIGPQDELFELRSAPDGQVHFHGNVGELETLLEMFDALGRLESLAGGAQLLRTSAMLEELTTLCDELAAGSEEVDKIGRVCGEIGDLIRCATATLVAEPSLRQAVDEGFAEQVARAFGAVFSAARRAAAIPPPPVPGTGFGPGRSSGVLFGKIPALDIFGPAILIAPAAVTRWARSFRSLDDVTRDLRHDSSDTWLGVSEPELRAIAVALGNVVQHELTHAMVALPNDAVEDFDLLFRARWSFYDRAPEFEEGLCDATAAVATTVMLLKARFGIVGRSMPRLNAQRYATAWDQFFPAIAETYDAYYGKATNTWLQAWENNNRDFGAFSGLVKLYSTNFSGIDWDKTFSEFEAGRISTGR